MAKGKRDLVTSSVRFETDTYIKISHIAEKNRRSFNAQMEYLALLCIEEYEREKGEIPVTDEERYAR
ncbi:MAG: hypothetical protein LBI19_02535 [Oscillospiraceae bacterium]|jgi:hypothetical protein|nr:hypothetical protein [Oscillospiraceae bacterium]